MIRIKGIRAAVVAACLLGLVACDSGPQSFPVTGTVSYQGKAVSGGLINFKAPGRQPLGGAISSDGTFSFSLPQGEYEVRIETPPKVPEGWKEGDPDPVLEDPEVPVKYAQYGSSGLKLTVDGSGPQQSDFNLP